MSYSFHDVIESININSIEGSYELWAIGMYTYELTVEEDNGNVDCRVIQLQSC